METAASPAKCRSWRSESTSGRNARCCTACGRHESREHVQNEAPKGRTRGINQHQWEEMNSLTCGGGDKKRVKKNQCGQEEFISYWWLFTTVSCLIIKRKIIKRRLWFRAQLERRIWVRAGSCSSFTFLRLNGFRPVNSKASRGLTSCHQRSVPPKETDKGWKVPSSNHQLVNSTYSAVTISSLSFTRFFKKTQIYTSKHWEV